jgi:flagellar hook-associated protein 2
MADISIPGVKSRFDTDKTIEGLMEVERIPRKRVEKSVETLKSQKTTWQDLGRRITALRDGASQLYSYQNPFNERSAVSQNTSVIEAVATREARSQSHDFTVKQIAQADKLISKPLDKDYKVPAGTYRFTLGSNEVSFKYGGGTLQEFSDTLNRRAQDKLSSSLVAIRAQTKSFVLASELTGVENKLGFEDEARSFAIATGLVQQEQSEPLLIRIKAVPSQTAGDAPDALHQMVRGDSLKVAAMSETLIDMNGGITPTPSMLLKFETAVTGAGKTLDAQPDAQAQEEPSENAALPTDEQTAQDASEEGTGQTAFNVLSLKFTDETSVELAPIANSSAWTTQTMNLFELAEGKTIASLAIHNQNARHEVSIRGIQVMDPLPKGDIKPINAVSAAQDAVMLMDGIEIERPTNSIDDLIPGLTLKLISASETPVSVQVENNSESIKDAVISLVGNYNRLMAELNVLTRTDDRVLNELSYLSEDERTQLKDKLGTLAADSSVQKLRSDLISIVNAPYPISGGDIAMLANFGISTDARRAGNSGYDPSRLRGYLEIDENKLDETLALNSGSLRELMGRDTDGDLIIDSGMAYALTRVVRPFVEIGGIIAGKTSGIDTRIAADNRRIEAIDRQLAQKESNLRRQYGQMEDAYNRMERMTNSLDNFSTQNSGRK